MILYVFVSLQVCMYVSKKVWKYVNVCKDVSMQARMEANVYVWWSGTFALGP